MLSFFNVVLIKTEDPLHSVYVGRPIEEDPSSPRTSARIINWVKDCNEHPDCTAELPLLPARVIDIGDESGDNSVVLREVQDERGRYVSLSHCWGKATQFTTTKASLASHKTNIVYDKLPQSFRDAISITRLLGIRYIWIDSICICQDDNEDWERESAKMTSIYMNSYLTIAAAAAEDSTVGCYLPRKKPEYISMKYKTKQNINGELQLFTLPIRKEALDHLYVDMADSIGHPDHPLATRAWAVQERALPRRTLHFGKHQMYFECSQGFRGENGLHITWRFHSIHPSEPVAQENKDSSLSLWHDILWNYGPRKLTKASDKLPAISGLARIISERMGNDEYLAGLWRSSLIEGLMWQGLGAHRAIEYRAPSWSWASIDGVPGSGMHHKYERVAEIIDCKVEPKGKNAFGEVKSGWIKLRAPLVPLIMDLGVDLENEGTPYGNNPKVRTQNGDPDGFYSRFDFAFSGPNGREESLAEVESLKGINLFALILLKIVAADEDYKTEYGCLIVRSAKNDKGSMQRQGFAHISEEELGECSQLEHVDERAVVTLI
jgi:hypothetical protein